MISPSKAASTCCMDLIFRNLFFFVNISFHVFKCQWFSHFSIPGAHALGLGLKGNYGCLIDFLSQISTLSRFKLLDLADFLMHHWFPVSFFDVASLGLS